MDIAGYLVHLWDLRSAKVIAGIAVVTLLVVLVGGHRALVSGNALANSRVSLLFWFSNTLVTPWLALASAGFVMAYGALGLPSLSSSAWQAVPFPLLVLIAFLANEFWIYWSHRWLHSRWGWPIHAIHHSDTHVNGFTLWRIHVLEAVVMQLFALVMISWMGLPPAAAGAGALVVMLHAVYIHSPLDWDHGPLRMVIASPRFHRWHHADAEAAYNTNLANAVPLFDWLFGTYRTPHRLDAPMGARSAGVPDTDFVSLWVWPFMEWARMIGEAVGVRPRPAAKPTAPLGLEAETYRLNGGRSDRLS